MNNKQQKNCAYVPIASNFSFFDSEKLPFTAFNPTKVPTSYIENKVEIQSCSEKPLTSVVNGIVYPVVFETAKQINLHVTAPVSERSTFVNRQAQNSSINLSSNRGARNILPSVVIDGVVYTPAVSGRSTSISRDAGHFSCRDSVSDSGAITNVSCKEEAKGSSASVSEYSYPQSVTSVQTSSSSVRGLSASDISNLVPRNQSYKKNQKKKVTSSTSNQVSNGQTDNNVWTTKKRKPTKISGTPVKSSANKTKVVKKKPVTSQQSKVEYKICVTYGKVKVNSTNSKTVRTLQHNTCVRISTVDNSSENKMNHKVNISYPVQGWFWLYRSVNGTLRRVIGVAHKPIPTLVYSGFGGVVKADHVKQQFADQGVKCTKVSVTSNSFYHHAKKRQVKSYRAYCEFDCEARAMKALATKVHYNQGCLECSWSAKYLEQKQMLNEVNK